MTATEIMMILAKAKECGVHILNMPEIQATFYKGYADNNSYRELNAVNSVYPIPNPPEQPTSLPPGELQKVEEIFKDISALDQMSSEQIQYAHSAYAEELEAKTAEHIKKLKEGLKHDQEN